MNLLTAALIRASSTSTTVAHATKSSGSILDPIAKPIAWLLAEIYSVVPNYGIAIMVLSVIWMLLIAPLTLKSTRSMLAMQQLQPQLKALQAKHKNDRQAFAQAQMELFKEHQVSPFGSCLPMLLRMPVFFALFRVIDGLGHTVKGPDPSIGCTTAVCQDPKYLSHTSRMFHDIVAAHGHLVAFGMDLSKNALSSHAGFLAALPFFIVLLIMAGTGYLQSAQMMSRNQAAQNNPQMKLMKYIPFVFAIICAHFPAGVILYYSMSNICRIVQQDAMYRFDPKVKALVVQEVAEVEEMTEEIDREKGNRGRSPGAGGGTNGGAPKPAPKGGSPKTPGGRAKGSAAPAGRSRFGNLLAAAQEQQKKSQDAKAAAAKTPPGERATSHIDKGRPSNGNGNGNGAAKGGPGQRNGSASAGQNRSGAAGRTNKKRRGR
jgi:YidC/Oxa1 family membrane protein insertase